MWKHSIYSSHRLEKTHSSKFISTTKSLMKKVFWLALWFILFWLCFAHQPRLVYKIDLPASNPLQIENPNISQAFYAELKWTPEYYSFSFDKSYTWYTSIVIPMISWATKDFSFELQKNWTTIIMSWWTNFQRWEFYEEFAWDQYFQGPEFKQLLGTGDYLIKVFTSFFKNHKHFWLKDV